MHRWALIVADFRREYGMTPPDLAAISKPEFLRLLEGLSDRSRWREAWTNKPKVLHDPADREAVKALARR